MKALKLVALANEYQLALLKEWCNQVLLDHHDLCLEKVIVAERYNLKTLYHKSIKDCVDKLPTFSQNPGNSTQELDSIDDQLKRPENSGFSKDTLIHIYR